MINENADVNFVCMLQWFGPFEDISKCKEWIKDNGTNKEFNFYFVYGKSRGKGKFKPTIYCGITRQKLITDRFNKNHQTQTLNVKEIWVARFSDSKLRKLGVDDTINPQMNFFIEVVEHGLINYFAQREGNGTLELHIENEKKMKSQPKNSLCIVNQWYDRERGNRLSRKYNAQKILPSIIYFDLEDNDGKGLWKYSESLKQLKTEV